MTLARVLDFGSDVSDEADLRIRKRTAVASALAFMVVGAVLGFANLARGLIAEGGLALVQVAVFAMALLAFRRNHRLAPLYATMALVGTAVLFFSIIPSGGLQWAADDLTWIILVPLGGVLFLGPRAAAPALGLVIVAVVAAVALDPVIGSAPPEPSTARLLFSAVNLLVPAAVALALVVFIDGERVRAKAESEALLLNVLPRSIAERLKRGERVIADHHDEVTVLFADLVGFTPLAAREPPERVIALLNEVFSGFDSLAERHGLEKIKTIGDSYMVVSGAPEPRSDHAAAVLEMALSMHAVVDASGASFSQPLRLRIGLASGPVVAGVIGHRKFSYDVWGDAVNLASRMESTGVPGAIQVAASTRRLCGDRYVFTERDVEVKGMGRMRAYLLTP